MDECVITLLFLQFIAKMEYEKKTTKVGCMRYQDSDDELQKQEKEVSHHAYELLDKRYREVNDRKTSYTNRELQSNRYELTSAVESSTTYHIDTKTYRFSCIFMRTELLSCRHVIYWRMPANKSPIPINYIHPRWSLTCSLNIPVPDDESAADGRVCRTYEMQDSALCCPNYKVPNITTKFRFTRRRHGHCGHHDTIWHTHLQENDSRTKSLRGRRYGGCDT
ncbi:hypothetical protein PI124_g13935 [Phytophthora idaei]|nr:hypothetical protein PI125_g20773 [Phytophthora idaei]KAG3241195.1 hypothetical protein PI124_g13935 [Phytophthora idaei]